MKAIFKALMLFLFFIFTTTPKVSQASTPVTESPYTIIKTVGGQLFADIAELDGLPEVEKRKKLRTLIRAQLMPHIDTKFVSFKLLGKHIREIKKAQAVSFIEAVDSYLLNTYTNVLMSYKGQEVKFVEPLFDATSQFASVKSEIVAPNTPVIEMQFKFRKSKSGEWQVYDIVAENISLLDAKQKEIVSRISEVGIEAVTSELKAKS